VPILVPPAILSILIALIMADDKKRPKLWLGVDLLLTSLLFLLLGQWPIGIQVALSLPGALILLGCILGIMDW
jgi:hypothetical protein